MIYVPDYTSATYPCVYVRGSGLIRAYREQPQRNRTVQYREFYSNNHYEYIDGEQSFSSVANLPVCLVSTEVTGDIWYRNDIDSILITFMIIAIIGFYMPFKIFVRIFKTRGV